MKKRVFKSVAAALLVAGLVACGGADETTVPLLTFDNVGAGTLNVAELKTAVATYPIAPLSTAEAASLAYMREEEQLAHDVFMVSAGLWALPVFTNIAASQTTHSAAIQILLDRYQQPDPLVGLLNGSFNTTAFQILYNIFAATSRISLIQALTVGVEVEELTIRDITAQKMNIDNADILLVYDNLLSATHSHIRAFMKELTQRGGTYVPKYITQADFDAIMNAQ